MHNDLCWYNCNYCFKVLQLSEAMFLFAAKTLGLADTSSEEQRSWRPVMQVAPSVVSNSIVAAAPAEGGKGKIAMYSNVRVDFVGNANEMSEREPVRDQANLVFILNSPLLLALRSMQEFYQ
jgi:hypothetical protein